MFDVLKKLNYIFDRKQKLETVYMLALIIIGSALELVGVSAVMPFINAVMEPDKLISSYPYNLIYDFIGLDNSTQFIVLLSIGLVIVYLIKNSFLIFMYNRQYKYIYSNMRALSTKMMKSYFLQPYSYFIKRSSSELLRNINQDTADFFGTIQAVVHLTTEGLVVIILIVYLFIKDKMITVTMGIVLATLVFFFMRVYKKYLFKMGEENRKCEAQVNKWVQQAFGGIKEIKVLNKESFFLGKYNEAYNGRVKSEYMYHTMISIPKPVIEAGVMSALLLAIVVKLIMGTEAKYFVPTISIFAVAAIRLLPSFNRIAEYLGTIVYQKASVNSIYKELKEIESFKNKSVSTGNRKEKVAFYDRITVSGLTFIYEGSSNSVLENVDFEIYKNSSVALIGPSGAGKTTLADLILGVLEPTKGKILVDGMNIQNNIDAWHKTVGYIPQTIYLLDDSIRNNIAFGIEGESIDDEKIISVCKKAQLYDYIKTLPEGIDTEIGEMGVKLSGGQRQRIGIARALYKSPDILILDEATSALDNETEAAVMEAIDALHGEMTLIVIAHRLSTIKNCDCIYRVEGGKVINE